MKYIAFGIEKYALRRITNDISPITGSKNHFGLEFTFDEEFAAIAGEKCCEFYKDRNLEKVSIVDGKCAIPNSFLDDKGAFEIRVLSGNAVATPWIAVNVITSGAILPESVEELPEEYQYVKTLSGDEAAPLLRHGESGLEYSWNGVEWVSAVNGVPEVPTTTEAKTYVRSKGDWVEVDVTALLNTTVATVEKLDDTADLTAVIAKVNELIDVLKTKNVIE